MKANVLVGQAGGPSAVINASLAGVIAEAQQQPHTGSILGMRYGIEGFMEGAVTDLTDFPAGRLDLLRLTPGSALGSCRYKLQDADLPEIRRLLEKHNIGYFFYIGGNDTMDTICRIESYCKETGYDLTGVGVPKTVDNDLFATDHTPGYPSAARYVAMSVKQSARLACDMQRVDRFTIFQTVGRDSGWLAAASALAATHPGDPPHLIYVPERPLTRERVAEDVRRVIERYGWAFIVTGEGVVWEDGTPVSASAVRDGFSNVEFGATAGTAAAIALHQLVTSRLGYRGEFQIPESLQMCASDRVSEQDRKEAEEVGREAVRLAVKGVSGQMVTIGRGPGETYVPAYSTAALAEVARNTRPVPAEFLTQGHVTPAFLDYLRPLVGELPEFEVLP